MNRYEVTRLLAQAKATDNRIPADDAQLAAWIRILDPTLPFDFAQSALTKHYAVLTYQVMPADINGAWRPEREHRRLMNDQELARYEQRELVAKSADPHFYATQIREKLAAHRAQRRQ
jgi:hypothetical protein